MFEMVELLDTSNSIYISILSLNLCTRYLFLLKFRHTHVLCRHASAISLHIQTRMLPEFLCRCLSPYGGRSSADSADCEDWTEYIKCVIIPLCFSLTKWWLLCDGSSLWNEWLGCRYIKIFSSCIYFIVKFCLEHHGFHHEWADHGACDTDVYSMDSS